MKVSADLLRFALATVAVRYLWDQLDADEWLRRSLEEELRAARAHVVELEQDLAELSA